MDSLLFLMNPILWDTIWRKQDIYIVILIFLWGIFLLFLGRYLRSAKKKVVVKSLKKVPFVFQDPEDPEYERNTLHSLKQILANLYTPNHTESHTVKEIGQYVFDSELIELAKKLETAIYQWTTLTPTERKSHNDAIKICLQKIDTFLAG